MPKKLEFFYDYSSPWTYLAFTKIEDVAQRHDAELIWRPILVGGLFNTVNPSVYESRAKPVPAKISATGRHSKASKSATLRCSRSIQSRRCVVRSSPASIG